MFNYSFKVGDLEVGRTQRPIIIAEAGTAHFGSMEKMQSLVDLAVDAGADILKTQAFCPDQMISKTLPDWQKRMKSRNVSFEFIRDTKDYCMKKGIPFLCTPHDETALEWLIELEIDAFKIGSGERGNFSFLKKIAERKKPIILSTGMCDASDVDESIKILEKNGCEDLALLHCVTAYPTPQSDVNLRSISFFQKKYQVPIGYSDHTPSPTACIAAVALGACIIERHITLDYDIPNAQDWRVSSGPDDFADFVYEMQATFDMMGKAEKKRRGSELSAEKWAIKRIVTTRNIYSGNVLLASDLQSKRAGFGITSDNLDNVIGRRLVRDVQADFPICEEDLGS